MIKTPSSPIRSPKARELQGRRAGLASRVAADGIDWCIVVAIYVGILLAVGLTEYFVARSSFSVPRPPLPVTLGAEWVIAVLYLTAGWASTGRTIGKSTMGLRVVNNNGRPLRSRRAFFRALICHARCHRARLGGREPSPSRDPRRRAADDRGLRLDHPHLALRDDA